MNEAYKKGYERIFGNKIAEKGCWVFDPVLFKLVPKADYAPTESRGPTILGAMEEFRSPIDGTVISDRGKLRKHNETHGVTNIADYGESNGKNYFERKSTEREAVIRGNTQQAKQERIETIKWAIEAHEK